MLTFPVALIKEAEKWADCKEDPKTPNRSYCVDEIHKYVSGEVSNDPWCSKFATMILDKVSKAFGIKNKVGLVAGTHYLLYKAKQAGIRIDKQPAVGSIMFYDTTQAGKSQTGHVGYVAGLKSGAFDTIEGNSGNKVGFRVHENSSKYKFIHVEEMAGNKEIFSWKLLVPVSPWIILPAGYLAYRYLWKKVS